MLKCKVPLKGDFIAMSFWFTWILWIFTSFWKWKDKRFRWCNTVELIFEVVQAMVFHVFSLYFYLITVLASSWSFPIYLDIFLTICRIMLNTICDLKNLL